MSYTATGSYAETTYNSRTVVTFTGTGTISFPSSTTVNYLVVGGGGSGGASGGGGGGGGHVIQSSGSFTGGSSYSIAVGNGGSVSGVVAGTSSEANNTSGGTSTLSGTGISVTAYGGGKGGSGGADSGRLPVYGTAQGGTGYGSGGGGGGCGSTTLNLGGANGNGNKGADGSSFLTTTSYGGGGGGAGGAGGVGSKIKGGYGYFWSYAYSSTGFGGGGGGGTINSSGSGGIGYGGGSNGTKSGNATSAIDYTGGGGGGGTNGVGGAGGKGVVIIVFTPPATPTANITATSLIQAVGTLNATVSGTVTSNGSVVSSVPVVIRGLLDATNTVSTNTSGIFTFTSNALTVGNTYSPNANVSSSSYTSTAVNLGSLTISKISATVNSSSLTQSGSNVAVSGILQNATTSANIADTTVTIYGMNSTANVTTNTNGLFSNTFTNLTSLTTYYPNVSITSATYSLTNFSLGNVFVKGLASITTGNIYQVSGTSNIYLDGTVLDNNSESISNVNVVVDGLDTESTVVTNASGIFTYTSNSLTISTYTPNVTVSDNTYISSTYDYSNITLSLINATITTGSIYQVSGTSNIYLDGTLTNTVLGTPINGANIVIDGLDTEATVITNASGNFTYTSNSLIVGATYTPNVTVIDDTYTSTTYDYTSVSIEKISATLLNSSIIEIPGTLTAKVQGTLQNSITSANITNSTITIIGFDTDVSTSTNTSGYFMYTSGSLIPYTTYYLSMTSDTYANISIGNITILPIAATITPTSLTQINGTSTANVQGILTNTTTQEAVAGKTIHISGFGDGYVSTVTNFDGSFGYTSNSLTTGNTYTITGNVSSIYYSTSETSLGNITISKIPATITTTDIYQVSGTANIYLAGGVTNTALSTSISNVDILIDGLDSVTTVTTDASGNYSYTSDALVIGDSYTPNVTVTSETYTSSTTNYSTLTMSKISATITATDIYQVSNKSNIYLSGILTNTISGSNISGEIVTIYGLNDASTAGANVTTNEYGVFTYTSNSLTIGSTYTPNAIVSSDTYTSASESYTSITLDKIATTITTTDIYQASGTANIYLSGTVTNTEYSTPIDSVDIIIQGLDSQVSVLTDTSGNYSYTSNSLTIGSTYTPNVIVSSNSYTSSTEYYSSTTIEKIPGTITTTDIYQVSGTANIYLSGNVTNTALGTSINDVDIIIKGLETDATVTTNASGNYTYTSNSLTIGSTYTPNVIISSNTYSGSTIDYSSVTISMIPITITPETIYQISGTRGIYLSGKVTNTTTNANISGETVIINGIDANTTTTTTDIDGIFSYTSSDLITGNSYTPNANVSSMIYISTITDFSTVTIEKITADVVFSDVCQTFGESTLYLSGTLINHTSNAVISGETINIYGLDTTYSITSGNDGSFSCTTGNLSIGTDYQITANLTSANYQTASLTPYKLVQVPISNGSKIYSYSTISFTNPVSISSTTRNQIYSS